MLWIMLTGLNAEVRQFGFQRRRRAEHFGPKVMKDVPAWDRQSWLFVLNEGRVVDGGCSEAHGSYEQNRSIGIWYGI